MLSLLFIQRCANLTGSPTTLIPLLGLGLALPELLLEVAPEDGEEHRRDAVGDDLGAQAPAEQAPHAVAGDDVLCNGDVAEGDGGGLLGGGDDTDAV